MSVTKASQHNRPAIGFFSIRALSFVLVAAMTAIMTVLLVVGFLAFKSARDAGVVWRDYDLRAATKTDALTELYSAWSLNGLLSCFSDVRPAQSTVAATARSRISLSAEVDAVTKQLRLARANLELYSQFGSLSAEEKLAIQNLTRAQETLETETTRIKGLLASGTAPSDIVSKLDLDQDAIVSTLKILSAAVNRERAVLSQANLDVINRQQRLIQRGGSASLLLLAGLIAATIFLTRQRILSPLQRLVSQAGGLAKRDLDTPFAWPGHDEMAILGRTLDDSRQALSRAFHEITDAQAELQHQATHDELTGLPNRSWLMHWLRGQRKAVDRGPLALLFIDLDGFKIINDSLGHAVGDKLLKAVAGRLRGAFSGGGPLVRLGGDEFVVLLTEGEAGALTVAQRLETILSEPYAIESMTLSVTASIGIAQDEGLSENPEDLLRDADIALYRAKERGKARTEVFNTALREAILIRHRLQTDLSRAIAANEIFLVYQPIVRMVDRRPIGFEALVRWRHPELGLISPAQFIPIAEETGTILPLGRYVAEAAASMAHRLRDISIDGARPTVNLNLSARQILDEQHMQDLLDWLGQGHADGLKIEVTESMTIANPDQARRMLNALKNLGLPLCMDDFGTGYSSLSQLTSFPFDVLKIDKSFVTALSGGENNRNLLRGVVRLAHDLGLSVVAEGVETEAEQAVLSDVGCDFGQGYLFAKPLESDAAETMLRGVAA